LSIASLDTYSGISLEGKDKLLVGAHHAAGHPFDKTPSFQSQTVCGNGEVFHPSNIDRIEPYLRSSTLSPYFDEEVSLSDGERQKVLAPKVSQKY
jgi:hypothetical protein